MDVMEMSNLLERLIQNEYTKKAIFIAHEFF